MNDIEKIELLEHIAIAYKDDETLNNEFVSPQGRFIKNKELAGDLENLIQENKKLKEHLQKYYNGELFTAKQLKNIEENQRKYFIHKSKLKEIIYPSPENYISLEVQQSDMYKKLKNLVED